MVLPIQAAATLPTVEIVKGRDFAFNDARGPQSQEAHSGAESDAFRVELCAPLPRGAVLPWW